ncbi:AMP-binding protein [Qaidamihabitans albus]|uniref:AMP-binding protein n=1 Tax=Qaidamihabitans albus TaxID=2795733 RepID=UPI0018F17F1B|nr:AMP-binding protein [Qaidamihabitans albus]
MIDPFVRSGERVKTLSEVKERALTFAGTLRELGVKHGDRYAIVMRNEIAFLEVNLAAGAVGAVPVPVNWHWTGDDLKHILSDSGSKVAVVHTDLVPAVETQKPEGMQIIEAAVPDEVRQAYGLDDVQLTGRYPVLSDCIDKGKPLVEVSSTPPMAVIYTSGTTGLAKGIVREPVPTEAAGELAAFLADLLGLAPGLTTVMPAPLYHSAPNVNLTFAAALGMNIVILPKFDPEEFLRVVETHRVDVVQLVPTMFLRLLRLPEEVREKYDISSLREVVHSAQPCPPDVKRAMIDWVGPIVSEYYGGSEGGPWVKCTSEEWLSHPGTVGRPVLDAALRIMGPDLEQVPVGEAGIIYGRSPSVWPDFTYLNNDAKRRDIDGSDGFITVGDVGRVDEDGYLYLTDRLNDMVISGGVNIYPAEIEASLLTLDGVKDVAVFGIPDREMGEALAAHVELMEGAQLTEQDVRDAVRSRLAKYKVPRVVVFEDELPREDSGKLFKRRLKNGYWPQNAVT